MIAARVWPAIVLFSACFSTGCEEATFDAITVPPPSRIAELNDDDRTIELSKGVALAFDCTFSYAEACGDASIASSDANIAAGFLGYSGELQSVYDYGQDRGSGDQSYTRFVVVGYEVGTSTLSIRTEKGDADFLVQVFDTE